MSYGMPKLGEGVKPTVRPYRPWPRLDEKKLMMQCAITQRANKHDARAWLSPSLPPPPPLPHLWSAHTLRPTLPWCEVHMNSPVGDTVTPVTAFLNHIQSTILPVGRSHILIKNRHNIMFQRISQRTYRKAQRNHKTHKENASRQGGGGGTASLDR